MADFLLLVNGTDALTLVDDTSKLIISWFFGITYRAARGLLTRVW